MFFSSNYRKNISNWDVSTKTNIKHLFSGASNFNFENAPWYKKD
jgi:hypothetical protein